MEYMTVLIKDFVENNTSQFLRCEGKTPVEAVGIKYHEMTGEEKDFTETEPRINGVAFIGEIMVIPLH